MLDALKTLFENDVVSEEVRVRNRRGLGSKDQRKPSAGNC